MKNAWNHEIKCKEKGKRDLSAFKNKNLAKILEENDKKFDGGAYSQRGEREVEKLFEKVTLKSPICLFKKPDSRVSIDQKSGSIDRNKQGLYKNNLKQIRSIENQFRSIETDRGFLYQI